MKNIELTELSHEELKQINGGNNKASLVAYGLISGLALTYTGIYGWAYVTYNYVKD